LVIFGDKCRFTLAHAESVLGKVEQELGLWSSVRSPYFFDFTDLDLQTLLETSESAKENLESRLCCALLTERLLDVKTFLNFTPEERTALEAAISDYLDELGYCFSGISAPTSTSSQKAQEILEKLKNNKGCQNSLLRRLAGEKHILGLEVEDPRILRNTGSELVAPFLAWREAILQLDNQPVVPNNTIDVLVIEKKWANRIQPLLLTSAAGETVNAASLSLNSRFFQIHDNSSSCSETPFLFNSSPTI
jgi:hypothetical protein